METMHFYSTKEFIFEDICFLFFYFFLGGGGGGGQFWGPNEQFGTHEKLPGGGRGGKYVKFAPGVYLLIF